MHVHLPEAKFRKLSIWRPTVVLYRYGNCLSRFLSIILACSHAFVSEESLNTDTLAGEDLWGQDIKCRGSTEPSRGEHRHLICALILL